MSLVFKVEIDVYCLIGRVEQARVLREHQVWEAAKLLDVDLETAGQKCRDRFRALMTGEALIDATLLLASLAEPQRQLRSIGRSGDVWVCTLVLQKDRRMLRSRGIHADLAAAVLLSILQSSRPARAKPEARPQRTGQKNHGHGDKN